VLIGLSFITPSPLIFFVLSKYSGQMLHARFTNPSGPYSATRGFRFHASMRRSYDSVEVGSVRKLGCLFTRRNQVSAPSGGHEVFFNIEMNPVFFSARCEYPELPWRASSWSFWELPSLHACTALLWTIHLGSDNMPGDFPFLSGLCPDLRCVRISIAR
jgi:hypothetical protein